MLLFGLTGSALDWVLDSPAATTRFHRRYLNQDIALARRQLSCVQSEIRALPFRTRKLLQEEKRLTSKLRRLIGQRIQQ